VLPHPVSGASSNAATINLRENAVMGFIRSFFLAADYSASPAWTLPATPQKKQSSEEVSP
jgi:hypothetical protein